MTSDIVNTRSGEDTAGSRTRLAPKEWASLGWMGAFILALHVIGWGVLIYVAPRGYQVGTSVFGIGTGVAAYTLGMRHAFDADHIAAIDNTTRKLMADGKRPLSVGFWFSLGHSSVVFLLTLLLAVGVTSLGAELINDGSSLHSTGGLIGTAVSGTFLYLIGIINLVILIGIVKVFRRMRRGDYDELELDDHLNNRGFFNRLLRKVMRTVDKPWKMYPIGLIFGVGFDTVTEVGLLVLAGTSVASGLPWYAILALPILFAAGMSLLDTIDGTFMNFAYAWAFSKPVRRVYYNITITGLSVLVALLIGTIELLAILADRLSLSGPFWDAVGTVDLNRIGFAIAALFVITWVVALAIWRFARIEERWSVQEPDRPQ